MGSDEQRGWGCLFWQAVALQSGKRPVYLFSTLATLVRSRSLTFFSTWLTETGNYNMGTPRHDKWSLDRFVCTWGLNFDLCWFVQGSKLLRVRWRANWISLRNLEATSWVQYLLDSLMTAKVSSHFQEEWQQLTQARLGMGDVLVCNIPRHRLYLLLLLHGRNELWLSSFGDSEYPNRHHWNLHTKRGASFDIDRPRKECSYGKLRFE